MLKPPPAFSSYLNRVVSGYLRPHCESLGAHICINYVGYDIGKNVVRNFSSSCISRHLGGNNSSNHMMLLGFKSPQMRRLSSCSLRSPPRLINCSIVSSRSLGRLEPWRRSWGGDSNSMQVRVRRFSNNNDSKSSSSSSEAGGSSNSSSGSGGSSGGPIAEENNSKNLYYMLSVVVFMFGLTYASVPLYKLFCQVTGFGGTTQRATEADAVNVAPVDGANIITIDFDANVPSTMPWKFYPTQKRIKVVPGETALAFYTAKNPTDDVITGIATYNVHPPKAGLYFNKIQCFCFEEQRLGAKEEVDMPVFFYIDPDFINDPAMRNCTQITLSYTFFDTVKLHDKENKALAGGKK